MQLLLGNIFTTTSEVIVVPQSTEGNVSQSFLEALEKIGVNTDSVKGSKLGDVDFTPSKNRKILFATSVKEDSSSYTTIYKLGKAIAIFTREKEIKSIAIPLLGTGAGKLDELSCYRILRKAMSEYGSKNTEYEFYTLDKEVFQDAISLKLDIESSKRLTFHFSVESYYLLPQIKEIVNSSIFFFEKARHHFLEYVNYLPQRATLFEELLQKFKNISFEEFLNSFEDNSEEYIILKRIGVLVAHIDSNAYNKNLWNEYSDKRTIARANVRQNNWIENLLKYRARGNSSSVLTNNIRNAFDFLINPSGELSMLSENHRTNVSINIFAASVPNTKIIFTHFDSYNFRIANSENRGHLYTRILYIPEVRELWEDNNEIIKSDDEEQLNEQNLIVEKQSIKAIIHSDIYAEIDMLEYNTYAHTIVSFLKHPETKPPLTVGILAPWGKGKTTMMKFIQKKLNEEHNQEKNADTNNKTTYGTLKEWIADSKSLNNEINKNKLDNPSVWFNAWKFQKSEEVWAGFAHEIIHQLVNHLPNQYEKEKFWFRLNLKRIDTRKVIDQIHYKILNRLLKLTSLLLVSFISIILSFILFLIDTYTIYKTLNPISIAIASISPFVVNYFRIRLVLQKEVLDLDFIKYVRQPDYTTKMGYFHSVEADLKLVFELLVNKKKPVVIFIDDLDRCSPKMVADVMEAINLFISGDFPDCYFILGQDAQMVAAALDTAYKDMGAKLVSIEKSYGTLGWHFMEKFIQLQFCIPNINHKQSRHYLESLLNEDNEVVLSESQGSELLGKIENLSKKIDTASSNEDMFSTISELREIESLAIKYDTEKLSRLREKIVEKSAENFTDDDTEMKNLIDSYSKYLGNSPRVIKRFVNLYRFYRFLQFSGQNIELSNIDSNVLGRWVTVMVRWPQLVRSIQWETEKGFLSKPFSLERAVLIEKDISSTIDFETWLSSLGSSSPPWCDEEMYNFLKKTKSGNNNLANAVMVGMW